MNKKINDIKRYCESLTQYKRYKTREVYIGDVPLGGNNPIRIQSMTTTDTMNTSATVEQSIRMIEAGSEYIRITAPSINEAKNLDSIKKELRKRGYTAPLIADIHFTPNAAEMAARIVEKVRVNPGNYVDKKKFETIEYSNAQYEAEIERIRERFSPLVKICKEYGTAMRIGTNHGSLSDRIMSRYGDSPLGMVESALEFLRICEGLDYHNIVLSMKASNPQVMVQAYRLLINKMEAEGMNYPLHLGVTEAGDGEDGRIKSAVGIGSLLEDGIGDTIRVSLTEDPEFEPPVAKALVNRYENRSSHKLIIPIDSNPINPFDYSRRTSSEALGIGGSNVPRVFADYSVTGINHYSELEQIGYFYDEVTDKWSMNDMASDFVFLGNQKINFDIPNGLKAVYNFSHWKNSSINEKGYPLFTIDEYKKWNNDGSIFNFVILTIDDLSDENFNLIKNDSSLILIIQTTNSHAMAELRRIFFELIKKQIHNPVIIKRKYDESNFENFMLHSATDVGSLLIDGFGDGIFLMSDSKNFGLKEINRISFGILQAARVRISKTEYIACPSCGRTLFDLMETTDKIRKRTEHLKGVKIAIMGCIVNGPGEMADADYGYVGSGIGKITLYRNKDIVRRSIDTEYAVDQLIELIKQDGRWIEPTFQKNMA
ncbi:MAG: (E)-4-hydroxy-3-methylbut-2-enyl-diphosphate synthase [Ignavibacteriaceae bacterium]|nr:(E)-4-hydroxy-3-methylbut-2-enyl-diphosphate synthase [Ignavibacteriaceae bacterium]